MLPDDTTVEMRDEIVEEIRRIRDGHSARFGYDLDAIVADFKSREREGGFRVVKLAPRRREFLDAAPR